jgi:hypothetical protein
MKDETKNAESQVKALDQLFAASAAYNTSQRFLDLLNFITQFPSLSPYNASLVHIQNGGVRLVMPESGWKKYGRLIKHESRPLIILAPFGPVELIYDIADTEGEPIPEELINPFPTNGDLQIGVFDRTIRNCLKDKIRYQEDQMHKVSAGYACAPEKGFFKVVVNISYSQANKYSSLIHELAHIYAGHLGVLPESWWKSRHLSNESVEVEAESISYLVCKRMGLQTTSEIYLSNYIKQNTEIPSISFDVILTVAGYIEQLGRARFRPKKK